MNTNGMELGFGLEQRFSHRMHLADVIFVGISVTPNGPSPSHPPFNRIDQLSIVVNQLKIVSTGKEDDPSVRTFPRMKQSKTAVLPIIESIK